ncbi:hypothetical protein VCUG_02503 [Vavraia culicis subsp. floridensis]|uniref:Uncharacterized protein n=1 Tax=Vavraia culicis (isolate floridensis) TaxID=948595 RepID=L2GRU3_VAVCU|nr:uncharacterized protein VCUG_02503 [Vavraia culicis subsp. floridensis]ELA46008.1 hypothetical protein VCUG_02503 [Vavraia culicis subsp. floridensis]
MIFEYSPGFRKLYFYSRGNVNESIPDVFTVTSLETIDNVAVYTVEKAYDTNEEPTADIIPHIKEIYCRCNKVIDYQNLSLLPSHNWHEYIDLWSCHNSEFKSTLDFKPKARHKCIILGAFFMIPDRHTYCHSCYQDRIFYNEVNWNIPNDDVVYMALCKHFESNTYFYIADRIEIILFGRCYFGDVEDGQMFPALKIGFKTVKNRENESELLNSFFREKIICTLTKNKLGIKMLDYDISFISGSTPAETVL